MKLGEKTYRAVIFDMDGTIIDSLGVWVEADRSFASGLGLVYDEKMSQAMKTMHFASACDYLKAELKLEMSADEIGRQIMDIVSRTYMHDVPLKPCVMEYMKVLRDNGVKMCVATSNDSSLANGALKNLGVYDMLEFVITSDEVGEGKETPLIFDTAAKMMGIPKNETIVFEDSIHALSSAKSSGFITVGVCDEKYDKEGKLLKEAADFTVYGFDELIN